MVAIHTRQTSLGNDAKVTAPVSEPIDQQQLIRIRNGEKAALSQWFEQNVDAVYTFVFYRVGNDPDLAADATQGTFTEALQRLDQYDANRGSMVTWLRTLSRNVIRKVLTTHRRESQLQTIWDRIDQSLLNAYSQIDQGLLPDAALERKETKELVGITLANLPEQYKEVLEAKYVLGYPLETIAQMRNTTVDSVKSMLRRARAAFRETFLAIASADFA